MDDREVWKGEGRDERKVRSKGYKEGVKGVLL